MRKCLLSLVTDPKEAEVLYDKAEEIYNAQNTMPLFKNADFKEIKRFLVEDCTKGKEGYYFLVFKDAETEEPVGIAVVSIGCPWYNPKILVVNEELTVAFTPGYGIARNLSAYLKFLVDQGKVDVAQAGNVQERSSKVVENTYKKAGYKSYSNFYYISEDLEERLTNRK